MPDHLLSAALVDFVRNNARGHRSFPNPGVDYYSRFVATAEYLNREVHPQQAVGAAFAEHVWLNDHGPEHVAMVLRRASDLLFFQSEHSCLLTPYEAFLLCMAIHFHDVGNYLGREDHERRIAGVMSSMGNDVLGSDTIEKRLIKDIAMAHGGQVNGDKDTIGKLEYDRTTDGPDIHALAAILRFADELADDYTRTSRFIADYENTRLYEGSEMFHRYSDALKQVHVSKRTARIELKYELTFESATRRLSRLSRKSYLLDEVFSRTLKMHHELIYCSRYWGHWLRYDQIDVSIAVLRESLMPSVWNRTYVMKQRGFGYPDRPRRLVEICPLLAGISGSGLRREVLGTQRRSRSVTRPKRVAKKRRSSGRR